ncbi:MAG: hypothetical protein JKY22_05185 [Flavobacteriaceae bacterium]|nr:hypothetical protein [Flavobacteriaceae bacterium]
MNTNNDISQEQLEQIDSYLQNSMPEDERTLFEHKLQTDENFKVLFEDIKKLILGIESASLKSSLDGFHNEMIPVKTIDLKSASKKTTSKTKLSPFTRIKWYAAASIIVLLGLFLLKNDTSPSEQLFAQHFLPDPGLPTTMGSEQNFAFYDAMVNYKQGDYSKAISKWQVLTEAGKKSDTLYYFLGVAHLANGNQNDAINYLQNLQDRERNSFQKETALYLGLAYLKADNVEDAKKYLTFSGTVSAQKILSDLKNN